MLLGTNKKELSLGTLFNLLSEKQRWIFCNKCLNILIQKSQHYFSESLLCIITITNQRKWWPCLSVHYFHSTCCQDDHIITTHVHNLNITRFTRKQENFSRSILFSRRTSKNSMEPLKMGATSASMTLRKNFRNKKTKRPTSRPYEQKRTPIPRRFPRIPLTKPIE